MERDWWGVGMIEMQKTDARNSQKTFCNKTFLNLVRLNYFCKPLS